MEKQSIRQELDRWGTLLEYYRFENSQLKNRLAEALEGSLDDRRLVEAEFYQNEFLRKDQLMQVLRIELRDQEALLAGKKAPGESPGPPEADPSRELEKFRESIRYLGREFSDLKDRFTHYLSAVRSS